MTFEIRKYLHVGELDPATGRTRRGRLVLGRVLPLDDEARALPSAELRERARLALLQQLIASGELL